MMKTSAEYKIFKNNKAQSAMEYIILLAAIIGVLIIFLNPTGSFKNTVERTLNTTVDQLNRMTESINIE